MENNRINYIDYSLTDLEQDCWLRLVNGATKARSPFHLPTVANAKGDEIKIRTVVLRKALAEQKQLRFHTDIRSPKWTELCQNPHVGLVFYDPTDRIQLRIQGMATLHSLDEITSDAWSKTTLSSRRCYLSQFAPSDASEIPTSGLPSHIEQEHFSWEESEKGYANFGVIRIHVNSIDWLWLHHAGHRRALFDYQTNQSRWLIP